MESFIDSKETELQQEIKDNFIQQVIKNLVIKLKSKELKQIRTDGSMLSFAEYDGNLGVVYTNLEKNKFEVYKIDYTLSEKVKRDLNPDNNQVLDSMIELMIEQL